MPARHCSRELMLAHEQGTGKSFAAFCISYVWRARRVLIAAPLDLHDPLSNPFSPCMVRIFRTFCAQNERTNSQHSFIKV